MNDTHNLLGLREVADTLALSEMTIRRLVKRGELPAFQAGRKYRIRAEDLAAYIHQAVKLYRAQTQNGAKVPA